MNVAEGAKRAKVSIARCGDYDPAAVRRAVRDALAPLGGISAHVHAGQKVLIKPNLLSAKEPDRAITTHPSIVEALIAEVREAGGVPSVGDSPGGALRGVERVWRNTGMLELAERTGVELVSFEASGSERLVGELGQYMIARPVLEADVVISVPKMKTHILTSYTGCVKNMYGSMPGFAKGRLHSVASKPLPFSRHIVDIYALVRPTLHVMDAVVAMEGDGPSGGRPRAVGAIIASVDGVAIDAVAADMMGYSETVHTTRLAAEKGLGVDDLEAIEVVGVGSGEFDLDGFALPGATPLRVIPTFVVRALRPLIWTVPVMSKELGCRAEACGLCVRSCPVEAIRMEAEGPVVDRKRCVQCMCCHEVCPEQAVRIEMSWLAKKFA